MWTGNVPNDVIQNIDPFALIILIPIMDRIVYPGFRRIGFPLRPILRIALGFFFGAVAMYVADEYTAKKQVMQWNVSIDPCFSLGPTLLVSRQRSTCRHHTMITQAKAMVLTTYQQLTRFRRMFSLLFPRFSPRSLVWSMHTRRPQSP